MEVQVTPLFQRTVAIASCGSRTEAELKSHALDSVGIPTTVATDDAGGLHPELAFLYCGAYRLVVPEDRADEAREILQELEDAPPAFETSPDELIGQESAALTVGSRVVGALVLGLVVALIVFQLAQIVLH